MVPTKRTNHVELSHQLNSLVHSCTEYKSRWQGTNWRLSMALASVTQISTKCLYFPCLIKKIILLSLVLYFTANVLFQGLTIFHFVWQFLYELGPRTKRKVHVFLHKKSYLLMDSINVLWQNYFPLKKENWKYLLKLEWLAIMFSSCVKVHVLSFYCTISCFRNR